MVIKILHSVSKKVAYTAAALIILFAVLVLVSRLLTPKLEEHRTDIENWASNLLKTPVTIHKLGVSWYHYQPVITLNEVTALNKDTKEPLLQIKKLRLFFSLTRSLWERKLILSGVMLSGTDIQIVQAPTGEITVQGFHDLGGFQEQPYAGEAKLKTILRWMASQPNLYLQDVDVRYKPNKGESRYVTLEDFRFENNDTSHTIAGKATLHQDSPTELTLNVQWLNSSDDLANLKVHAYMHVAGFSIAQWLKDYSWNGWQIKSGTANAKIWLSWTNGSFRKIQCTMESYGLELYSATDKSTHKINRLSGDFGWKQNGNSYVVAGDDIFIDLPNHLWPSTSFYVSLTQDAAAKWYPTAINVGYLDINDMQPFLFSSPPFLPDPVVKALHELKLKGDVESAVIASSSNPMTLDHVTFTGNVRRLCFASWHQLPSVTNLAGTVTWNGVEGNIELQSTDSEFLYRTIFTNPIKFDQLSGNIGFHSTTNNAWELQLQSVKLINDDVSLDATGKVTLPATGAPVADIKANLSLQEVQHVTRYLPMHIFDPDLVKWLEQAFLAGSLQSGSAVLQGALSDFPFDKGNGVFNIKGDVKHVDFRYAPDWPEIKDLDGRVDFAGRRIAIEVNHANILGIPINKVHAVIPYLGDAKPQEIQVQTETIQSDFTQGLNFLHASPLEKTIGKMFTDVEMHGPMQLTLNLDIPLKKPDAAKVKGDVTMQDADMDLVPWKLKIAALHGQFQFTENSIQATGLQGSLFDKPMQLDLQTVKKSKSVSVARATVINNLSIVDLQNWLKIPFGDKASGAANVTTTLDFSLDKPVQINLQSNLSGIAINLPDQYGKKAADARNFTADITLAENEPLQVKMTYGNLLAAALILERKNDTFNLLGADLRLGTGIASLPATPGLYLTGTIDQLDWEKISSYMNGPGPSSLPGLSLRGIDVQINKLNLLGQQLTQAKVQVVPNKSNWEVNIASSEVTGQIRVPLKITRDSTIEAQLQRIQLQTSSAKSKLQIAVKTLPSIMFDAKQVYFDNLPLGEISFSTSPSASGMAINSLKMNSPYLSLLATGDWTQSGTRYQTHLQGRADSTNVSKFLSGLGFDVHNFIASKGHLSFNLNWQDAPFAPSMTALMGTMTMDIGEGRIVDVGQSSGAKMDLGRMLSIFSLQTIPRRLSFDFSDVFQKGYSFDVLRGDFKFSNGDAYTSNTYFDGPVARVDIYGRIGVARKDYDFTLSVTPYVTSSIPIAATLITGQPLIGIAAFAVNRVIGSEVSKATTYYYSVNGPWSNPSWNPVSMPKKAVPLSSPRH